MITRNYRWLLAVLVLFAVACFDSPTGVEIDEEPQFSAGVTGTTYYVSPNGKDSNSGTSPLKPWKTINKVNHRDLDPGDQVLFQGGATFNGTLQLNAQDAGTPANPITISTYGTGKATINAGGGEAIMIYNAAGHNVSNLNLIGAGVSTSTKAGLNVYTDLPGDVKLAHIYIDNVEASGFTHGILIGSWNNNTGFTDVRVTNVITHDNKLSGVNSYAMNPYAHKNFYFARITAYNHPGDPALPSTPSGNGIVMGGVDGGTIERSLAYNNGTLCQSTAGPVGIWAYDASNIVIQYNESYNNSTSGPADGGGFDLDQNTKNSVMQYNYSHNNAGPGYLLAQSLNNANHTGNIVRYNISENDGRKNSSGAIVLWGKVQNAQIYNNSVYLRAAPSGSPRGIFVHNSGVTSMYATNVGIRNNIFQVNNSLRLLQVPPAMLRGVTNLRFENNDYFSTGTAFKIVWGGTTYTGLPAWRSATSQEMAAGQPVGTNANPLFNAPGAGGTIGNPDQLTSLSAYQLQPGSTMADTGMNLVLLGISVGARDFYGNPIPQGSQYSIGAHDR